MEYSLSCPFQFFQEIQLRQHFLLQLISSVLSAIVLSDSKHTSKPDPVQTIPVN